MKHFFFLLFFPIFLHADPQKDSVEPSVSMDPQGAPEVQPRPKPSSWQQSYNDGREAYYKDDFEQANQNFTEALQNCPKPEDQEQIFYNLGNTHYQQSQLLQDEDPQKEQHLNQSLQNFQSALALNKEAKDTQNNLELVEQALERLNKNKAKNKKNNESKNNNDNKKEDKKEDKNNPQNNSQQSSPQQGNQDNKNQPEKGPERDKESKEAPVPQKQNQEQPSPPKEDPNEDSNEEENPPAPQPKSKSEQPNPPQPKPGAGEDQPDKKPQDPKSQEIANILKKSANGEKMFPQNNQPQSDQPVTKDW